VTRSSPTSILVNVDFPDPDSPTIPIADSVDPSKSNYMHFYSPDIATLTYPDPTCNGVDPISFHRCPRLRQRHPWSRSGEPMATAATADNPSTANFLRALTTITSMLEDRS